MDDLQQKVRIGYLLRKPSNNFHSIEGVYKVVKDSLGDRITSKDYFLPSYSAGILNKLKNLFFGLNINEPVLHVTGEVYYAALLFRGKLIITIHDIGILHESGVVKRWLLKLFWFQLIALRSKKIIIISEHSKKEFIEKIGVGSGKIIVIPNPSPLQLTFAPYVPNREPRILQIGTKENKNLVNLAKALNGIDCHLHIVGKLSLLQEQTLNENSIRYTNNAGITFEELKTEYGKSDIVSFVSTYEGFGLPILEAQAVGRAVLTSNMAPMNEVAGDGALLADPQSIKDIRKKMLELINDVDLRHKLIEKGKENIKKYAPGPIAEAYYKVYEEVTNG